MRFSAVLPCVPVFSLAVLVPLLAATPAAQAQTTSIVAAVDRSNYSNDGSQSFLVGAAGNYFAGILSGRTEHDYFIFNIPTLSAGQVYTAATFTFNSAGFASPQGTETLSLRSIDRTSLASLSGGTAGTDGYADLADGVDYGSATVTASNTLYTVVVSSLGLSAINQKAGAQFGFGGFISTIDGVSNEYIAGASTSSSYITRLTLTSNAAAAAPEPSTLPLLGMGLTAGLAAVGAARRGKAKRTTN